MTWRDEAWAAIERVDGELAATTTLAQRMAAVDAAYPFGARDWHPYRQWLKARRTYLARYGYRGRGAAAAESPLERLMRRDTTPA